MSELENDKIEMKMNNCDNNNKPSQLAKVRLSNRFMAHSEKRDSSISQYMIDQP